jgi:hypothetical protein
MDPRHFDDLVKRLAQGTSRRKVLKGFAGGIAGVFAGGVAKQTADAAPDPKVTICHFTHSETNPYNIITVSSNSQLQHHLNHGDSLFGDCCIDSDCSVPDGTQCAIAVCQVDGTGTSFCGLVPNPSAACDDGIACTENDVCGAGVDECSGTPNDALCDDSNACTTDTCVVGVGCTYADVICDDGDLCTTDSCDPATGCVFTDIVCTPPDVCVDGDCVCLPGNACDGNEDCCPGEECCQGTCTASCGPGQALNPDTCVCQCANPFACGDVNNVCAGDPNGPSLEICLCTPTIEGGVDCGNNFVCGSTPLCDSNQDCVDALGDGSFCQGGGPTGCCGAGQCVPPCGATTLSRSLAPESPDTGTNAG